MLIRGTVTQEGHTKVNAYREGCGRVGGADGCFCEGEGRIARVEECLM